MLFYGFAATEVQALPGNKLGVVVIATLLDCADRIRPVVAETALRMMSGKGQPLPAPDSTRPIPLSRLAELAGHYTRAEKSVDVVARNGKLYLSPYNGALTVEVRSLGDSLAIDDRLAYDGSLRIDNKHLSLGDETSRKTT